MYEIIPILEQFYCTQLSLYRIRLFFQLFNNTNKYYIDVLLMHKNVLIIYTIIILVSKLC